MDKGGSNSRSSSLQRTCIQLLLSRTFPKLAVLALVSHAIPHWLHYEEQVIKHPCTNLFDSGLLKLGVFHTLT